LLATGSRLKTSATENGLKISIPATAPDSIASVIRLEVKGKVEKMKAQFPKKKMESGALD